MLDPDVAPEARVPSRGHVAGGVDVRDRGAQVLVDGDPALGCLEPAAHRELEPRNRAHADDDQVGRHPMSVRQADLLDGPRALDEGDMSLDQAHATLGVQLPVDLGHLGPEDAL